MKGKLYGSVYPMLFGSGCVADVGGLMVGYGCKKVMVISDESLRDIGMVKPVTDSLESAGIPYVCWYNDRPDPTDVLADKAGEFARREQVDGLIGLGGGGPIDTAKAVDVLIKNPGNIREYLRVNPIKAGTPTILIPTTTGSSAELTPFGVLTDSESGSITLIYTEAGGPRTAVYDPDLTLDLPPSLTASTGFDLIAHLTEGYTCNIMNPLADSTCMPALREAVKWLPLCVNDGKNIRNREGMMWAYNLAGVAFSNVSSHINHAIGHCLGKKYHLPHGAACSFALPEVIAFMTPLYPSRVKQIAEIFGAVLPDDASEAEIAAAVKDVMRAFKKRINVRTIKSYGLTLEQVLEQAETIAETKGNMYSNRMPTKDDILLMLKDAYENE